MVNILVDDKTPAVCEAPPTLYWYCDDAGGAYPENYYEYAWALCGVETATWADYTCRNGSGPYNQVEIVENGDLLDVKDSTGAFYGWYGCNIYGDSHVDEYGEPAGVCESEYAEYYYNKNTGVEAGNYGSSNWAPVYCHSWLLADQYDRAGQIDPQHRPPPPRFGPKG